MSSKTPVFLLKTRSAPEDAYEDLFSTPSDGFDFEPIFVPVLEHHFDTSGVDTVRRLLLGNAISRAPNSSYGGLVFTSQRAVETFSAIVQEGRGGEQLNLPDIPVYSVGPATTRALRAVPTASPLNIFGGHTGNGEKLAPFIVQHYGGWYRDRSEKQPLQFLFC